MQSLCLFLSLARQSSLPQPLASLFISSHHRIGKLRSCLRPRLPPNRRSSSSLRPNERRQTQNLEQTSASLACARVANRSERHDQESGRCRCRFQGVMMDPASVRRLTAARESPNPMEASNSTSVLILLPGTEAIESNLPQSATVGRSVDRILGLTIYCIITFSREFIGHCSPAYCSTANKRHKRLERLKFTLSDPHELLGDSRGAKLLDPDELPLLYCLPPDRWCDAIDNRLFLAWKRYTHALKDDAAYIHVYIGPKASPA